MHLYLRMPTVFQHNSYRHHHYNYHNHYHHRHAPLQHHHHVTKLVVVIIIIYSIIILIIINIISIITNVYFQHEMRESSWLSISTECLYYRQPVITIIIIIIFTIIIFLAGGGVSPFELGDGCLDTVDCTAVIDYSVCSEGTCQCDAASGYVTVNLSVGEPMKRSIWENDTRLERRKRGNIGSSYCAIGKYLRSVQFLLKLRLIASV